MQHNFSVDLRGIVDLLGRHLYSSPRVYVRELLQNSVDAITARRASGDEAEALIRIEPIEATGDGTLRIHDTGIGLTGPQVHELLATIGNSSKRDELGLARHDFLGQFGIGLLSCFLVADEIEVITRSGDAPTVRWRGHADGHYTLEETAPRDGPGTTVVLRARRDFEHWLATSTVTELARHYGSLLPYEVRVGDERITEGTPPWRAAHPSPGARRDALLRYGRRLIGAEPFDVIDLAVPEAGLSGVAFVLPHETGPGERAAHRVYLKRMLLGERVEKIMPDWAFFVRCVIDTDELRPTASREQLHEDDLLTSTREALGESLRAWLVRLASTSPERLAAFLRVHRLGVLALARHDTEMLRIVDEWLPFETSEGRVTLREFRRRHRTLHYTPSVEEFRQLAGIAVAQGMGLVNVGYTHHLEVLRRLPRLDPGLLVRRLDPGELATRFESLDPVREPAIRDFLATAAAVLEPKGCEPIVRSFEPVSVPVLLLEGAGARSAVRGSAGLQGADGIWGELVSGGAEPGEPPRPQLVFNHRNPLIARLTSTVDARIVELSVEALYGYAMLAGNRPLRPEDMAGVNRAFLGLVEQAVHPGGQG
ncbi:molecular chaperone HtpG [Actinomadura sp. NBRC 104412]|uniref:HSP90 family protein n=1 Tax=Actinomadura sp. NBRC 104412 TaxID=3032203 RepID=UPI0024A1AFFF|nr:HSP90 family protein [Actinomadura sp. NBRC 104412]GLZ06225.1 molecular chaperone HtpG [Actinomadura sp. NBRC 104412]